MKTHTHKTKGHSLMELLVVLSIMLAFSFTFKVSINSRSLESLGLRIRSTFFLAKSLSIYTGRTHGIYFSPEGFIELYDSDLQNTVNLCGIASGKNRLVRRFSISSYGNIDYGILHSEVPDPNNQYIYIPNHLKPIKMGTQNIMHIRPAGGVTNGSVYFMGHDGEYMLCIRTAFAYTRIFIYIYNAKNNSWYRL